MFLMRLFKRQEKVEMALELWNDMVEKGFRSYILVSDVLLDMLCDMGKLEEGEKIFLQMMEKGQKPSNVSFKRIKVLMELANRHEYLVRSVILPRLPLKDEIALSRSSSGVNLPQASEVDQVFLEGVENSIADSVLLADLSLADLHEPPSYSFNFWLFKVLLSNPHGDDFKQEELVRGLAVLRCFGCESVIWRKLLQAEMDGLEHLVVVLQMPDVCPAFFKSMLHQANKAIVSILANLPLINYRLCK
ncbi:hypothetical protein Nepgr_007195 [Nepenthes gracilis]|uniref:Pentatricopeptide repeat-containing protein n=1 Tax=Nepenthes gracilis TaxID=150966 RepID=A0AAD3XI51_NEPGR|nr:hypothetical protein Nepgr_007195 [Nepenthes gracilis]